MIVICPNCNRKYSVHNSAIVGGKLVRCVMCGATWHQNTVTDPEKRRSATYIMNWTIFWFVVFVTVFSLFFAKSSVMQMWPQIAVFYDSIGLEQCSAHNGIVVQNVSSFFAKRNGKLFMGVRGEIVNKTRQTLSVPRIIISLKTDVEKSNTEKFEKRWIHNIAQKKMLSNEKIHFETELQDVPCQELICDIKLDAL